MRLCGLEAASSKAWPYDSTLNSSTTTEWHEFDKIGDITLTRPKIVSDTYEEGRGSWVGNQLNAMKGNSAPS